MKRVLALFMAAFWVVTFLSLVGCSGYCNYKDCMEKATSNGYCSYHKDAYGGNYSKKCIVCKKYFSGSGSICANCR